MYRVTRSTVYADENLAAAGDKPPAPAARSTSTRAAFGDIANVGRPTGGAARADKPTRRVLGERAASFTAAPAPAPMLAAASAAPAAAAAAAAAESKMMEALATSTAADSRLSGRWDIDAADKHDPQLCADLVVPIIQTYRDLEVTSSLPSSNYMSRQTDINAKMREILIDWLVEVHLKFKLVPAVLFLTVNLIDRFLEKNRIMRNKLQLVGVTAMLVASKYEEIYAPEVRDFVYITDRTYTKEQILEMESTMLNSLGFQCTVPTIYTFLNRFIKAAGLAVRESTALMARYLAERSLQDFDMLRFRPSAIAAACVSLALRKKGRAAWSDVLQVHTQYTEESLAECVAALDGLARAESRQCKAVKVKFSSSRYGEVAKVAWA